MKLQSAALRSNTARDRLFPPPALPRRRRRLTPAEGIGRITALRAASPVELSPGELAELEAFDLARAHPGELAHILAGIRAGLYAAGVGRVSR